MTERLAPARYRGRPVLVTGATGFIGRAVARHLARAGADLTLAVRHREALPGGTTACRARIVEWSATDPDSIAALVRSAAPAIIFNLAGYGVDPAERNPDRARAINGELPRLLAEAMAGSGEAGWSGARVVHAGSALEYGVSGGSLNEATPARPTTLYGETKLAGTLTLAEALDATEQPGLTARLFTVYGPGERPGRLLPSLIECAQTGSGLDLSTGMQTRDFTYVEDVAEGLLGLGLVQKWGPGGRPRIVNLATGRLMTVRQFGEIAGQVLGIDPELLRWGRLPTRPEEMSHDPVDVGLARHLLGRVPETSVETGIRATVRAARDDDV